VTHPGRARVQGLVTRSVPVMAIPGVPSVLDARMVWTSPTAFRGPRAASRSAGAADQGAAASPASPAVASKWVTRLRPPALDR
jgi:hypothetical protein